MQFAAGGQQEQRYDDADEDRKAAAHPATKKQKHWNGYLPALVRHETGNVGRKAPRSRPVFKGMESAG
jgi:hypothetical protein